MYSQEPRVPFVKASREHIVGLYQSLNTPHLAVPGKQAQACQAYVVGTVNADQSYTVWVFLHLTETEEGVIFLSEHRQLDAQTYPQEEAEALAFLESMGFMADDLHYRERTPQEQEELVKTLPPFRALTGRKKTQAASKTDHLARLLASF